MCIFIKDIFGEQIRLTKEREEHFKKNHPVFTKMEDWSQYLNSTLQNPDIVIKSKTDDFVNLFYRYFNQTVVGDKYLCVVVKKSIDQFIVTIYFTDKLKEGVVVWKK